MSYGKSPYHIFRSGTAIHFVGPDVVTSVPEDALAQYIYGLYRSRHRDLEIMIERGRQLRESPTTSSIGLGESL